MNQELTPVKYLLGMWKTMPGYPTKLDTLYEIYNFLYKNEKKEFSEQTLNGIWYDEKGVANWKGTRRELWVKELISDGAIVVSRTEQFKGEDKDWYRIENNPFCG